MLSYLNFMQLFEGKKTDKIAAFGMLAFLLADSLHVVMSTFLSAVSNKAEIVTLLETILIGLPICLFFIFKNETKVSNIRIMFIFLFVAIFILFSILLHPEYSYWFFHETYGIQQQFLQLRSAIYALLFVGMVKDKLRLISLLIHACRFNLLFYVIQYFNAINRGYWAGRQLVSATQEMYNLTFGYRVAICAVMFLLLYLFNRKIVDLISLVVAFAMMILQGSRGSLVCLAVAFILFAIYHWKTTKKKLVVLLFPWLISLIIIVTYAIGFSTVSSTFLKSIEQLNIRSRTVTMLIEGEITEENGRDRIRDVALDMIENGFMFGYGFYGDRHIIGNNWVWGYPHNIFLEVFIEFGVPLGIVLLGLLIRNIIKMIVKSNDITWHFICMFLLSCCSKLLLSDSFWYYWPFWALIGIICIWKQQHKIIMQKKQA